MHVGIAAIEQHHIGEAERNKSRKSRGLEKCILVTSMQRSRPISTCWHRCILRSKSMCRMAPTRKHASIGEISMPPANSRARCSITIMASPGNRTSTAQGSGFRAYGVLSASNLHLMSLTKFKCTANEIGNNLHKSGASRPLIFVAVFLTLLLHHYDYSITWEAHRNCLGMEYCLIKFTIEWF